MGTSGIPPKIIYRSVKSYTCKAAALSAGTILNAAICTIRSKHATWFIFSIFLMFGYIDLKVNDLEVFSNR